jgi:hypothetical protein
MVGPDKGGCFAVADPVDAEAGEVRVFCRRDVRCSSIAMPLAREPKV